MTPTTIALAPAEPPPAMPAAGARTSIKTGVERAIAITFLVALAVPFIGTWRHWDFRGASNENRRLAEMPAMPKNFKDATKYSDRWLDFYRDHFGLRNTLIHAVAVTRYRGLGADTDGNVLIGKDGWLFLRPDGDRNFIAYRGLNPLSEEELAAWQDVLEKRNAWFASKGIPFLVIVPPDKQSIYPEFLPEEYQRVKGLPSRLDQLVDHLRRTHSPVHFIDLRPALLAAKPTALLYHHTDTHWNDSGAFVGYGVIIQAVKTLLPKWNIVPQPRSNFDIGPISPEVGDLARMMDTPDLYPDKGFSFRRKIPFTVPPGMMNRNDVTVVDLHDDRLPRLFMYRDSFGIGLFPMLGPHFGYAVYTFKYEMDPMMVLNAKPDLVISEFLERNLYLDPPTDPPAIRQFNLKSSGVN